MRKISACAARVGSILSNRAAAICGLSLGLVSSGFAEAVTLGDTGVDWDGVIAALLLTLGGLFTAVILAKLAFVVAKKVFRWVKGIG